MSLKIRHIKGYNGRIPGGLQAHPSVPGQFYYVLGSSILAVFEGDPTKQVQLRGHDDQITAFAMSSNGTMLASGQRGANSDVVVWDARSLSQKFRFQEHDIEICALGFSRDEKLLVTVGNEKERRLFVLDTSTGKIVTNMILLDPKRTKALAWSPVSGACYTFATAADMDIYLYTVDPYKGWVNCEKITTGTVRRGLNCLCFSADGAWLFAGTASGDVLSVNVGRKAVQMMHPVAEAGIGSISLSADGRLLVGALDGALSLFNYQQSSHSGSPMARVPGPISAVTVAARGANLLVGTAHGDIFCVAAGTAQVVPVMETQPGAILNMVWTSDGSGCIGTASDEGSVCVWNSGNLSLECQAEQQTGVAAQSVAVSPELVLSGRSDGSIHCHSRRGPKPGAPLWCIPSAHATAHATGVPALHLSHRGHFIASGGAGGELRVWDLKSREMVSHMKHHTQAITDLKVMTDDSHLLAASEDRTWSIWDIANERLVQIFTAKMGAVRGVAMAPDQVSVVSVGLDKGIIIWDIRKEQPVRIVPDAHLHEIMCCAINNRGNLIATGGADCAVKLWDFGSGRLLGTYAGHTSTVNKLNFSPDDNQLASVASDGSMVFWRIE